MRLERGGGWKAHPNRHYAVREDRRSQISSSGVSRHVGSELLYFRMAYHSGATRTSFTQSMPVHTDGKQCSDRRNPLAYCRRIRDWPAFALMSERITLSPGCSPSKTSIVFRDMRPNHTFTFVACMPSESILNRLASPFAAPKTGRPT